MDAGLYKHIFHPDFVGRFHDIQLVAEMFYIHHRFDCSVFVEILDLVLVTGGGQQQQGCEQTVNCFFAQDR